MSDRSSPPEDAYAGSIHAVDYFVYVSVHELVHMYGFLSASSHMTAVRVPVTQNQI